MTKEEIITAIKGMTVLDLAGLVKDLQEEFGVSAAMPMAGMMPGMPGAGVTRTRSAVMSSMRQLDAPRTKTSPTRDS